MEVSILLPKLFIFVVFMVSGYVFAKIKYVSPGFAADASKLVINFFMCATIINSVLNVETALSLGEIGIIILVDCIAIFTCYAIAAVAARLLPIENDKRPQFELLIAVMNNMFIALPVLEQIFGATAVFYCALSNIPFNIMVYSYGVYRLRSGDGGSVRFKDMLSTPIIATFISLIIFIFKLRLPSLLVSLIGTTAAATLPLSMIVIGCSLGSVSLLSAFTDLRMYLVAFLKLLICPVAVWFLAGFITDDTILRTSAMVIASAPSGVIVTVLSIQYGRDPVFSSKGILLTTVLSMFTIPLLLAVLH